MPRSRGRGSSSSSSTPRRRAPRPAYDAFDDVWLSRIRERWDARFIDLQNWRHRQAWHPRKAWGPHRPFQPARLFQKPRVVVVPEGHRLARLQTYGGRYSLRAVQNNWRVRQRRLGHGWDRLMPHTWPYGAVRGYRLLERSRPRPIGVALPWQVVVCVRRKARRSVLHALGVAGSHGVGRNKPRRTSAASNVRC